MNAAALADLFATLNGWLKELPDFGYTVGNLNGYTAVLYRHQVTVELSAVRYAWMPLEAHTEATLEATVRWLIGQLLPYYQSEQMHRGLLSTDATPTG